MMEFTLSSVKLHNLRMRVLRLGQCVARVAIAESYIELHFRKSRDFNFDGPLKQLYKFNEKKG